MKSRQRVLTALNHQEPDRIPIDLGGFQSGIHRIAYENLIHYLGIKDNKVEILDPVQQLAVPCEELLQRLHVDIRYIKTLSPSNYDGTIQKNLRNNKYYYDLKDEFGVIWSMPSDQMLYMDISHHPLADATATTLGNYPYPNGSDPSRFKGLRDRVKQLRNDTECAISTTIGGSMYEYSWYMRGLERWFMDIIQNPGFCEASLDQLLNFWLHYYTGYLGEVGNLVDIVQIGDDLAGQDGLMFSPEFYRQYVKPRQKLLISHIKSLTRAKIWYHTCGSCVDLISDLIEIGVDILNPVQISAANMEPAMLKERFGGKIVLWGGGCDTQNILPFAQPDEVRRHVKRNIKTFMSGGGYVFNNVHNIQADVSPQNILALFETAYEFGKYSYGSRIVELKEKSSARRLDKQVSKNL